MNAPDPVLDRDPRDRDRLGLDLFDLGLCLGGKDHRSLCHLKQVLYSFLQGMERELILSNDAVRRLRGNVQVGSHNLD